MTSALTELVRTAQAIKPIKADLRASTVTFEWPTNVLVQRAAYVVLPLADVEQAYKLATEQEKNFLRIERKHGKTRLCLSDDLDYQVYRGGITEICMYFERISDGSEYAKPGTWFGSETFTDTEGKQWSRSFGRMVVNDFGDLVNRETGEQ